MLVTSEQAKFIKNTDGKNAKQVVLTYSKKYTTFTSSLAH